MPKMLMIMWQKHWHKKNGWEHFFFCVCAWSNVFINGFYLVTFSFVFHHIIYVFVLFGHHCVIADGKYTFIYELLGNVITWLIWIYPNLAKIFFFFWRFRRFDFLLNWELETKNVAQFFEGLSHHFLFETVGTLLSVNPQNRFFFI